MDKKKFAKLKGDYQKTKKQLATYKWGSEKSKRGWTILYKEMELAKKKLEKETAKRKKAEEQLKEQLAQQKEIDRMKTEFVSLASHQLRTPLTAIKWYAEMILEEKDEKLGPKQKKYLSELYQGNERMIDLVGNLLNVSRLEMGVLAVKLEPVDVGELLGQVVKERAHFIQEKKHQLVLEITDGLPKIFSDCSLVRMVLQNLLGNAIEYTSPQGKITCKAEQKDKQIVVSIEDTGIGIPAKQQKFIFQKLFRADNAVREHSGGTGLELYITKAMVDALAGKIWFESQEGQGTTFWLVLPLKGPKARSGQKIINKNVD